jgi:membrane protein DedA with SNARE-associated domain/membrane-associated phospholipid phosphatase
MNGRSINWKWVRWGVIAAAFIAFLVYRDHLPHLNLDKIIEDLSESLGAWTYLLVGGLAFLETGAFVGLIAPGEFTVMLGGAVAQQGDVSLPLILAITWFSAFMGDTVSFMLGARLGRSFLVKHGARFRISDDRLKQVEGYFARHGGKTILIGRFIGLVRALAPFIAGSSAMRYRAFAPYSILGTGLWATGLILVGYFAAKSLDTVTSAVGTGLVVFGIVVGVIVAVTVTVRFLREPENRAKIAAEMERRRFLRPILAFLRRIKPELLFLWRRVTPGGLGLEFTTLLAALSVGLFVLIAYWSVVDGDPGPTTGDQAIYDFYNDIRSNGLDEVAKVVTVFGAGWVTWPLAAIAAAFFAVKRRWLEVWALVVGMLLIIFLANGIKDWTDRPRPPDPLVDVSGSSFPSGHAAYSTLYVWLAITVALRVVPGITRRSLVIVASIVLAALIGVSRAYLRVHWFSDVTAGWGLGIACFSAVAAVVLIVAYIRDNLRRHDRANHRAAGATAGDGH